MPQRSQTKINQYLVTTTMLSDHFKHNNKNDGIADRIEEGLVNGRLEGLILGFDDGSIVGINGGVLDDSIDGRIDLTTDGCGDGISK